MTREELIKNLEYTMKKHENDRVDTFGTNISLMCKDMLDYLEQEPCEMTAEEYRQRMIKAFHNADCDELIAVCVLPTEKEFEHLEWLLKNHYKKEPCGDTISREQLIRELNAQMAVGAITREIALDMLTHLPSVTPQQRTGRWIINRDSTGRKYGECSECMMRQSAGTLNYCPNCGAKMEVENG